MGVTSAVPPGALKSRVARAARVRSTSLTQNGRNRAFRAGPSVPARAAPRLLRRHLAKCLPPKAHITAERRLSDTSTLY
jgi:hypothetical protein